VRRSCRRQPDGTNPKRGYRRSAHRVGSGWPCDFRPVACGSVARQVVRLGEFRQTGPEPTHTPVGRVPQVGRSAQRSLSVSADRRNHKWPCERDQPLEPDETFKAFPFRGRPIGERRLPGGVKRDEVPEDRPFLEVQLPERAMHGRRRGLLPSLRASRGPLSPRERSFSRPWARLGPAEDL
jgi:hypothetical protein